MKSDTDSEVKSLLLPAMKAKMGDWIYYITFMKMEDIAKRVKLAEEIHKSEGLKEWIQRRLTDRAKEIAKYLLTQPQRFFNALIIGVYGGDPSWYEIGRCPRTIGINPSSPVLAAWNAFQVILAEYGRPCSLSSGHRGIISIVKGHYQQLNYVWKEL